MAFLSRSWRTMCQKSCVSWSGIRKNWEKEWKKKIQETGLVLSCTVNFAEYALLKEKQLRHRRTRTGACCSVIFQLSNSSVPLRSYEFNIQLKYISKERNPISSEIIYDKVHLTEAKFVCGIAVIPFQLNNKWISCRGLVQDIKENKRENRYNTSFTHQFTGSLTEMIDKAVFWKQRTLGNRRPLNHI